MKHNIEFFGGVDNTSSDFDKSTDELGKFINDILIAFDMTADELLKYADNIKSSKS